MKLMAWKAFIIGVGIFWVYTLGDIIYTLGKVAAYTEILEELKEKR